MYAYFRMTSYGGVATGWASRSRAAWDAMWIKMFGESHYIESTMVHGSNKHRKVIASFAQRCLRDGTGRDGTGRTGLGLVPVLDTHTSTTIPFDENLD